MVEAFEPKANILDDDFASLAWVLAAGAPPKAEKDFEGGSVDPKAGGGGLLVVEPKEKVEEVLLVLAVGAPPPNLKTSFPPWVEVFPADAPKEKLLVGAALLASDLPNWNADEAAG